MTAPCDIRAMLDGLCPMHLMLDQSGHICHAGPTMAKLRSAPPLVGSRFLERFELLRPRAIHDMASLMAAAGTRLRLQFRDTPATGLKGVLLPAPGPDAVAVINLSFGISVLDAVRDYALTSADFPATDLTMELLYLVEAKSAAMEASRHLNTRLQGAMIAAEEQAFTDTLTGLKNRRALDHVLARMLERKDRFALMHIDLDRFKTVNDSLGHAAGDAVLQQVARVMVEETRDSDIAARVGGDEFVILLNGLRDMAHLEAAAMRLIRGIEVPVSFEGHECAISASIGTVMSGDYGAGDGARMLADADAALYAAKHAGRATHRFFDPAMRGPPLRQAGE